MATPNSVALDVIQEFEESTDDAGFVAKIEKRVNEALDEIAIATNYNTFKTRATFATVASQAQYNMPVGARELIQLRYLDTGEPIPMLTTQEAARRGIKLEETGRPQAWLEDGVVVSGSNVLLRIRLWPVPSSILSIEEEHYFHPSDVASATVLPIQDQHVVLIKDRVRVYFLTNDQKYDAAQLALLSYQQNLERLVRREQAKVAKKVTLQETDLSNIRRRRGPRLPGNYPDSW
jgi:hypothetical protein